MKSGHKENSSNMGKVLIVDDSPSEAMNQKSRELNAACEKLQKTQDELKILNEQLEQKVMERTEKISNLISVILAVRNINQLIVRERDRDHLLQKACECLIEARGIYCSMIALVDESGLVVKIFSHKKG